MLWQPTRGVLQPNQNWRRGQGAPAGGFPSVSGTVLARYTAKTGVTLSGSDVTVWADQSGNGCNMSSQSGKRPTYSATGFNSVYPGIIQDTAVTYQHLVTANRAIATGGTTAMSFWTVLRVVSSASNDRYLATIATTPSSVDYQGLGSGIVFLRGSGSIGAYAGSSAANFSIVDNTNYRMCMVFDGVNITSYLNNVQQTQTANGNPSRWGIAGTDRISMATAFIGANGSGDVDMAGITQSANATWAEIVVMAGAASSGDRSALDSYFQTEWGL